MRDVTHGSAKRLVALEFGLLAAINLDWFAVKDIKNCSIGAVYITILNLPRSLSFKRAWTTLALVIPGPEEPSLLGINNVLRPLVEDLLMLETGMMARILGRGQQEPVYMQVLFNSSDMPATRKLLAEMRGFGVFLSFAWA